MRTLLKKQENENTYRETTTKQRAERGKLNKLKAKTTGERGERRELYTNLLTHSKKRDFCESFILTTWINILP